MIIRTAADEEVLSLPGSWLRVLHPRRGGAAVAEVRLDRSAPEGLRGLLHGLADDIERLFGHSRSDRALAEAARRYFRGEADPAGGAVVIELLRRRCHQRLQERPNLFVDAFVAEHGVAFAACCYVESFGVRQEFSFDSNEDLNEWIGTDTSGGSARWEPKVARRLRTLLAAADHQVYTGAETSLARLRRTRTQRLVVSHLVPTRQDWVEECFADPPVNLWQARDERQMLWLALGEAEQLMRGRSWQRDYRHESKGLDVLATLVDAVGVDAFPLVLEELDGAYAAADRRTALDVLGVLPSDEAFQALIDRLEMKYVQAALLAAAERFPMRAVRLLAAAGSELLDDHVRAHPEAAAAALPDLPEEARALVGPLIGASGPAEAPAGTLPSLLVDPPWTRRRKRDAPVVIEGLAAPAVCELSWLPGEQDEWSEAATPSWGTYPDDTDWEREKGRVPGRRFPIVQTSHLMLQAPVEMVRPLIATWTELGYWYRDDWDWPMRVVVRHGTHALPLAMSAALDVPASKGGVLLPFLENGVAALMTGWFSRSRSARPVAMAWFDRHGAAAVPLLVPAALAEPGKERQEAEAALRYVASGIGAAQVVEAARTYGDEAAAAVGAMLAVDPLELLPARPPKPPAWADPAVIPQVLLRDRERALPAQAAGHLITMLAMCRPGETYAGVAVVRELCDPASLAGFGWGLFERWQAHGAPSKDGWALSQLGLLGDDGTVRRLTPMIREWPGSGGHKSAVTGLDVLASIGTETALAHLYGISRKVRFKALKTRAQEKVREVAAGLGLTAEQLADRLVPDFGLDADGGLALDYGPRRFTVGFDERLKPYVADGAGVRLKDLPRPGAKDDPGLAPAAHGRFAALKKEVRTAAADQIARLEAAMVAQRRWTPAQFREFFADHPLIRHIARRLVWTAEDGGKVTTFRIAEDSTLSDAGDDVLTLPEHAEIGIAHPVLLDGRELAAWSDLFADYEILQPFAQLGRPAGALSAAERASERLARFEGVTVPFGAVLKLDRRGWRRGEAQDAGLIWTYSRDVAPGRHLMLTLHPGLVVGLLEESEDQRLEMVWLASRPNDHGTRYPFGELGAVMEAEILADLAELAAEAV